MLHLNWKEKKRNKKKARITENENLEKREEWENKKNKISKTIKRRRKKREGFVDENLDEDIINEFSE